VTSCVEWRDVLESGGGKRDKILDNRNIARVGKQTEKNNTLKELNTFLFVYHNSS